VTTPDQDWARFASVLAGMPDVVVRLLQDHRDDGAGRCRACTSPGRGIPNAHWPCGIAAVAGLAAGLAAKRAQERRTMG
jgi:hypothetical protein